ncbi:hypothetical protein [Actinacidiphila alni]|nr:hypothetical protein [Actinacidiphila alni]
MARVEKGSRRIVVDGVTYRWRLRRRPTYDQLMGWTLCTYTVERADRPGALLTVRTDQPHMRNVISLPGKPVLPSDVAAAVQAAVMCGWTPETHGLLFHLDQSDGFSP